MNEATVERDDMSQQPFTLGVNYWPRRKAM
jgi:hypothetical protein